MLNTVALMGRLTRDPEPKTTGSGVSVTSFTLAIDRSYTKQGEDRQADFIDVVAWRGTADFICKYFRKGQLIAVQGFLQTRTYTDKDGNKRKVTEVVAEKVSFAESKKRDEQQQKEDQYEAEESDSYTSDDDLPF